MYDPHDQQCNTFTKDGQRCLLERRHDGDHRYGPLHIELPAPRVQGFDRMFATLEKAAIKQDIEAVLFQMKTGEASDIIDSSDFSGELDYEGSVSDLKWCRSQLEAIVKKLG